MNPYHHALSSSRMYGGEAADYLPLHQWFDESKKLMPDVRHRALRHHAEGIFLAEQLFGAVIVNSQGREIPTRTLGEQHIKEDLGRIPTVQDWLACLQPQPWMLKPGSPPEPAEKRELCECEQPGYYCSGVPGILARMEDGKLAPGAAVERCDLCRRFASDEEARQRLVELGLA